MEAKELNYLELKDDERGIVNIIENETKGITIKPYVDYRDFNGIEKIVSKCKTLDEFECALQEFYDNDIAYQQNLLCDEIFDKIRLAYPNYNDLSDNLNDYIKEYVYDEVNIEYPFNQYRNHLIEVNMFLIYDNSTDAMEIDLDYKTLAKVLEKLNYAKPKTLLKELKENKYRGSDDFLRSLQNEILNSYSSQCNYLTFIGKIKIEEYYKMLENPLGTTVKFANNVYCGFVDPHCGGGSILGINLPKHKPLVCKAKNIKLLVEHSGCKYTVDDIFGLNSDCYKRIEVK